MPPRSEIPNSAFGATHLPLPSRSAFNRRSLLHFASGGLTAAALAWLGAREATAAPIPDVARSAAPHHSPQAKRVIHLCLCGGYSQLDTFDYKPALEQLHGKPLGASEKPDVFFGQVGLLRKSDYTFKQHGESGLWVSDLFPHLAGVADELTVVRSMYAESSSHTPATLQENSGWLGLRDGRTPCLRSVARCPRPPGERHKQLDQWLPAIAASRGDVRIEGTADSRSVTRSPDRC
jgi:hypothetical protein